MEWYKSAFAKEYLEIYAHRNRALAKKEVQFLIHRLQLSSNDLVLDLSCGAGRHSKLLFEEQIPCVGLDLSDDLLRQAKKDNTHTDFVRADMRALPFGKIFSAAILMFTSFAYFREDTQNERVISEVSKTLKTNGQICIDFLNPAEVKANLVPESIDEEKGYRLQQNRWINEETNRIEKKVLFEKGDQKLEYLESVRLYEKEDFQEMFQRNDLKIDAVYANFSGEDYSAKSERMIIIGSKIGSKA